MQVKGREHLPEGPCLLCPNHTSHVDSLALLAATGPLRNRLVFAAAKDYFFKRPRLARWNRRALPLIPWERGGNAAVMRENLRHLAACRAANRIVVFFPEGSRSRSGELQPFKDGFAFFAVQTGLPVVPCWIEGAHASLPKGASIPRPGRLHVTFGPALQPPSGDEQGFAATVRAGLLALKPTAS
jgi:1-acyl-sn-glycerol-3-phosphate acyltransferase